MDLLFIVRDAVASSVVGNLLTAAHAKKAGQEVAVVFTQEALAAVARGSFGWPRELSGQEMRFLMADHAGALGVPVSGRGESRQIDAKGLIAQVRDAGVPLYACPVWAALLGLDGKLPQGLQTVDTAAVCTLLRDAKQVIGTL
jgi:peroxiredoxin family protein